MKKDHSYVQALVDTTARTFPSELGDVQDEEYTAVTMGRGDTLRGWLLNVRDDDLVFLSGGADYYLFPRDDVAVIVHARNPRVYGLIEPPTGTQVTGQPFTSTTDGSVGPAGGGGAAGGR